MRHANVQCFDKPVGVFGNDRDHASKDLTCPNMRSVWS